MNTLKSLILIIWITFGSGHVPTVHTNHHIDEPVTMQVVRQYGDKLIG